MNQIYGYFFVFLVPVFPTRRKTLMLRLLTPFLIKETIRVTKLKNLVVVYQIIKEYLDYHNQDINANTTLNTDGIKRYKAHEGFGDRRQMVNGARTYFYQNEAQCEKNMETFLRCIEAVAGNKAFTLKSFLYINISCLEIGP